MKNNLKKLNLLTHKPIKRLHLNTKDLYVQSHELSGEPIPYLLQKPLLFPLAPPPPYDDNYDSEATALESESRSRFIEGDKIFFSRTGGQHIQINSGLRTVKRQAELWICWKQGSPGCNSANLPGCSLHNYGLAIDVIRTNEQLIEESLGGQGWKQTVNDEGWHFECLEALAHAKALIKITELRNGKAGEWANTWSAMQKSEKELNTLGAEYLNRRKSLTQAEQALGRRTDEFKLQVKNWADQGAQWDADAQELDARLVELNRRIEYSNSLVDQIESMPPGPERDSLYEKWLALDGPLQADMEQWKADSSDLNQRVEYLNREQDRLKKEALSLDAEDQRIQAEEKELQKMASRIEQLKKSIVDNQTKMDTLLACIETEVSNVG